MFYEDTDAMLATLRRWFVSLVLTFIVAVIATLNAATNSSATSLDNTADQWTVARYDRPAYGCAANESMPRVTYADLSKLQPCWNSSVHIRIEHGLPKVVGGNMDRDNIRLHVDLNQTFDLYQESDRSGKWDFTVIPRKEENGEVRYVFYFQYNAITGNPILDRQEYASLTGGAWWAEGNKDSTQPLEASVDVVLVAVDNFMPANPTAPVPFRWSDVSMY